MLYNNGTYERLKGQSLLCFPSDYTIIDLETTGRNPNYDSIIEIGALKVRDNKIVDKFSSLVNPRIQLDEFIINLTGISDDMLSNSPYIENIIDDFYNFIECDILIGHNVHFDINFLYDSLYYDKNIILDNDLVDTVRIARAIFPTLCSHNLTSISKELNIDIENSHRSIDDCFTTFQCLNSMRDLSIKNDIDITNTEYYKRKSKYYGVKLHEIEPNCKVNKNSYFFDKIVVFTGKLHMFDRKHAAQQVVNNGGIVKDSVVKDTEILVVGSYEDIRELKGKKTTKHRKAEKYILDGKEIEIIDEETFYSLLDEKGAY